MPENLELFYDDIYAALRGFVSSAGGSIKVAKKLWPHKGDKARDWLDECLNRDRPGKLDPEEFLLLQTMAREAGFHGLRGFIDERTGYESRPVEPKDELAGLYSEFIERSKALERLGERIARIQMRGDPLRAAK
jgi:hypothetical protein